MWSYFVSSIFGILQGSKFEIYLHLKEKGVLIVKK